MKLTAHPPQKRGVFPKVHHLLHTLAQVDTGQLPLAQWVLLVQQAYLTPAEKAQLCRILTGLAEEPLADTARYDRLNAREVSHA